MSLERTTTVGGSDVEDLKYLKLKRLLKSRGIDKNACDSAPCIKHLKLLGIQRGVLVQPQSKLTTAHSQTAVPSMTETENRLEEDLATVSGSMMDGCIAVKLQTELGMEPIHVLPNDDVLRTVRRLYGTRVKSVLLGGDEINEGTFDEWGVEDGAQISVVEQPDFDTVVADLMSGYSYPHGINLRKDIIKSHFGIILGEDTRATQRQKELNTTRRDYELDNYSRHDELNAPIFMRTITQRVEFPEASGTDVNMMPFTIPDGRWTKANLAAALPDYLHSYIQLLYNIKVPRNDLRGSRVLYLTVTESYTIQMTSQRRGGLHTEAPGTPVHTHGAGELQLYSARRGIFGEGAWETHEGMLWAAEDWPEPSDLGDRGN